MENFSNAQQLPPATLAELNQLLLALADTKHALGLRYAEWSDRAPRPEASVAASAMAQDQLGQARVLYAMLEEYLGATENFDDAARPLSFALAYLDEPLARWTTFVAANFLIGGAVTELEGAFAESRFTPLRARIPKMLDEERFHATHAAGWFQFLQTKSAWQIELAQMCENILPQVLCWFGDAQHDALFQQHIITATSTELRARFLERHAPLLEKISAGELVQFHSSSETWSYAGALPWERFDVVTRRVKDEGYAMITSPMKDEG